MIRTLFILGALAGAAALGTTVLAPATAQADNDTAKQDKDFVEAAAQGGLLEVKLGELAQQRAQSEDVKKFGQRMVDDHSKLNDQLSQYASQHGIALPDKPDKKGQTEYDMLSKLSGAQFDKRYMALVETEHKSDIDAFQKQAKSAKDPQLAAIVSSAIPTLTEHYAMAKQVRAKVEPEK